MLRILFIVFLIGTSCLVNGQNFTIGGGMGYNSYVGEMNDGRIRAHLDIWEPMAILEGNYTIHPNIVIGAQGFYGRIYGSDNLSSKDWMVKRNLNFTSKIYGGGLRLDVQTNDVSKNSNSTVAPYVMLAIEGMHYNPTTFFNGQKYNLRELGTGGQGIKGRKDKYNSWTLALQWAAGIKIRIFEDVVMRLELGYHKTFTDYLDDLSNDKLLEYGYIEQRNGKTAADLSDRRWEYLGVSPKEVERPLQRATGPAKDGILNGNITFHYTLPLY